MNREQWLHTLADRMAPLFAEAGAAVPTTVRIACGFPSVSPLGRRKRRIGECWHPSTSVDKKTIQVFISPVLAKPEEVAETLLHELVHAVVGAGHGHKGPFVDLCKKLGFTRPWTSTPAKPELKARLNAILAGMEAYPHVAMDATKERGSVGSRLRKAACPECGYTIRVTRQWLNVGLPTCPCGTEMEEL
jgi:hypothetical protein